LCQLLTYCIVSFECYANVCIFKQIGYLSYQWAVVCEYCPFFVLCVFFLFFLCCDVCSFARLFLSSLCHGLCFWGNHYSGLWWVCFTIHAFLPFLWWVMLFCLCNTYMLHKALDRKSRNSLL
jgi:hypothetical protein